MELLSSILIVAVLIVWGFLAYTRGIDRMILFLPVLFPAYLIKLNLGITFSAVELLVYESFIFFLLQFKKGGFVKKDLWQKYVQEDYVKITLLFFGVALLVFLVNILQDSAHFLSTLSFFKSYIFMPALYLSMLFFLKKEQNVRRILLDVLLFSGLLLSLSILAIQFSGISPLKSLIGENADFAGNVALYLSPLLVYILIVIEQSEVKKSLLERVGLFLKKLKKLERASLHIYFYWVSLILFAITMYYTYAYSAWISVYVGFFFYYIFKDRKLDLEKIVAIFAGVVVLAGLFATQLRGSKFDQFLEFNDRNFNAARIEGWQVAGSMIRENWFFGSGMGQFGSDFFQKAADVLFRPPINPVTHDPLNLILALWLNFGLIGVVAFVAMIVLAFQGLRRSSGDARIQKLVGLSMLLAILINGIFFTPFFREDLVLLFWTVMISVWGGEAE